MGRTGGRTGAQADWGSGRARGQADERTGVGMLGEQANGGGHWANEWTGGRGRAGAWTGGRGGGRADELADWRMGG